MESNVNFKYYAFISYSHEDEEFAKRIQKKLTEYKLPSVIRKANPLLPDNVRPIFRDATNLTTGMLQGTLNSELEHSKFLIVLCSPNSAKPNDENKHWVNKEVQHFIDLGRIEYIIPVIVGGEPHSAIPEEECFCPALLSLPCGDELLGIDIRNGNAKKLGLLKIIKRKLGVPDEDDLEEKTTVHIVAKMLGLDIDDLWDWNKKAQKRKAYAKLFGAAVVFVIMISGVLTVYFKKFHVYHKYYVDYVERAVQKNNGTDIKFIGLGKLTKKEIKKRSGYYNFYYQNKKLRRIEFDNSYGIPRNIILSNISDRPVIQEFEYNEKTGLLNTVVSKNEYDSVITRYVYEQKGNVIDLKNSDGSPLGLKSNSTKPSSVTQNLASIKSYRMERNEDGYITKKMYFQRNGAEDRAKDADGISGFEYVLDDLGRPVQIWYLGFADIDNESISDSEGFERHEARNGIAGYFLEYSSDYNLIGMTYVNSEGIPVYNDEGCMCIKYIYENGNIIEEMNCNNTGEKTTNSFGIAYCKYKYDEFGNLIESSSYDNKDRLVCNNSYYAIARHVFDNKGNIIQTSYFDSKGERCIINEGYHCEKHKYNSKNMLIETQYFGINNESVFWKGEYAKLIATYTDDGDIESMSFYGIENEPIYSSSGYAKIVYGYNENHQIKEEQYFDIDFINLIKDKNGVAMCQYVYYKGNVIEKLFFDENRQLTNNNEGIAIIKCKYTEEGRLKEESYYNKDNELTYINNYYTCVEFLYDKFGNLEYAFYYKNLDKELVDTKLGYAYVENQYDSRGNLISTNCYNSNKEPSYFNYNFCSTKMEYDNKNNEIKKCWYDKNSNLVKNLLGWAIRRQTFNSHNQIIKQEFFDEFENRVLFDNSHSIATAKYDDYGRLIEVACYDENGVPVNNTDNYSIIKIKYDYYGNQCEQAFYKNEFELVDSNSGFAIVDYIFDNQRNIIEEHYYDCDTKPVNNNQGYSSIFIKYDNKRNVIEKLYYDKNGELLKDKN